MTKNAFVLRIAPSGIDKVPEALEKNQIIIGWALADDLLNEQLTWDQFRQIISDKYYSSELTLRKAGAAAGNMWRFIREMKEQDYVIVPYGNGFYIAEIGGPAIYDKLKIEEDSAYRRSVTWLNDKKIIQRNLARSALISRMKYQGTIADATDLISDIEDCIENAKLAKQPSFHNDLQSRLIAETLKELHSGRIDDRGFERLIQTVISNFGAKVVTIVPRNLDKGADILATFLIAGTIRQVVAIQAKYWRPEPPINKSVVDQLIQGIDAASADLGIVITSGSISPETTLYAQEYYDKTGIKIELVDGLLFAKLIVENGIRL